MMPILVEIKDNGEIVRCKWFFTKSKIYNKWLSSYHVYNTKHWICCYKVLVRISITGLTKLQQNQVFTATLAHFSFMNRKQSRKHFYVPAATFCFLLISDLGDWFEKICRFCAGIVTANRMIKCSVARFRSVFYGVKSNLLINFYVEKYSAFLLNVLQC